MLEQIESANWTAQTATNVTPDSIFTEFYIEGVRVRFALSLYTEPCFLQGQWFVNLQTHSSKTGFSLGASHHTADIEAGKELGSTLLTALLAAHRSLAAN